MFNSMRDVRRANEEAGMFWFSPSTMRFFKSRVSDRLYGGRYFVSSEVPWSPQRRRYTVRMACDDGSIDTVGDLCAYATSAQAHAAARKLAEVAR